MSVPAAGGWTPKQREAHPGYPTQSREAASTGASAGSILLPDVMRRRREAALERRESGGIAESMPGSLEAMEDSLAWLTEGADQTPEAERVLREVRRAVQYHETHLGRGRRVCGSRDSFADRGAASGGRKRRRTERGAADRARSCGRRSP